MVPNLISLRDQILWDDPSFVVFLGIIKGTRPKEAKGEKVKKTAKRYLEKLSEFIYVLKTYVVALVFQSDVI